jgi:DNA-binding winged helix-turn-helix (wHTH) protein
MKLQFSSWSIDTDAMTLEVQNEPVSIEPRVFDLLALLAGNPGVVYSRDDLLEKVWNGRVVSDTAISSAIKSARKAIGDNGKEQKYIKTVHGRGFRFIETAIQNTEINSTVKTSNENVPCLLVLPFKLVSGHLAENKLLKFAQRLENILLRVPLIKLSAEASRYEEQSLSPRKIYEESGVTHLLDGFVEVEDDKLYLDVQLTDARAGFRIWSEQFEIPFNDTQAALDSLVVDIIRTCEPQLIQSIYESVVKIDGESSAYALYFQAFGVLALKGWNGESFLEASDLLRQCLKLRPDFAQARAYLSLILAFGYRVGFLQDNKESTVSEALDMAEKAISLNNQDTTILGLVGCAFCDVGLDTRGEPLIRKAIRINKSNGHAWAALGAYYLSQKEVESAIEYLHRGVSLSPLDGRLAIWRAMLALALLFAGKIEEAIKEANLACEDDNKCYMPRIVLAAARLSQEDIEAASREMKEAYRIKSDLSLEEIAVFVGFKLSEQLKALPVSP